MFAIAVAPVAFPIVIVLAFAFVPILIPPVLAVSKVKAAVALVDPACTVRVLDVPDVDQVEEAPPVRVSAAPVVMKEDAAPDAKVRAPALLFPIETAPVDEPVLILVAKFDEALRLTAAPVTVSPA